MEKLEERAPRTKQFIAVIGRFDQRFAQSYDFKFSEVQRKELEAIKDPQERAEAMLRLADGGIRRLEQAVREYIVWVRSHGGQ